MTTIATATAVYPGVTDQERERAHVYLNQSVNCLRGAIEGLSAAQWKFSPGPERWSIAEITDHAIMVYERVSGAMLEQLAEAPPPPPHQDAKQIDEIVMGRFPNRLAKFTAPPFILPTGRFSSPSEALEPLVRVREKLIRVLESGVDLRAHALPAPPLKAVTEGAFDAMDGYQWLLAAAAHAERHTKQILEVRASDNFPSSSFVA